jgi:uncharacterized protein YgiM (DUF1202 family)
MPDTCFAVVTADAANVRTRPVKSAPIVGIIRRGDRLPAQDLSAPDSENFVWVKVTVPANNLPGWVRGDLVQLAGDCTNVGGLSTSVTPIPSAPAAPTPGGDTQPGPTPPEVLAGDCQAVVNVAQARVRSEPSTGGASRGFIARGTTFAVNRVSQPDSAGFFWFGFDFEGAPGWVRQDLLQLNGDCLDPSSHEEPAGGSEPSEPTPVGDCQAVMGPAQVNVRAQPVNGTILGRALKDESYAVQEITPPQSDAFSWIRIDFKGQIGFVRFDLAMLQGDCSAFTNDDRIAAPVAAQITQGFKPNHRGLDFGASLGTELRVQIPAVVFRAHPCTKCTEAKPNIIPATDQERDEIFSDTGWGFGYGNHIIVRHAFINLPKTTQQHILQNGGKEQDNLFVLYGHLSRMDVKANDELAAGAVIGATGNTGNSTNPHLHLEVAFGKQWGNSTKIHPSVFFAVANK